MPRPLSREQSQARTRARLLDAGQREFVRRGLERTTIEQIAEAAGYTRGAFYAHFKSKAELCLALLEDRFDRYLAQFGDVLASDESPEVRAQDAGDHFSRLVEADPGWQRLSFEFMVYALRNEQFRGELAKRNAALRDRIAEIFRIRAEEYGIDPPIPLERLTLMTFSLATGIGLMNLVEPEGVPDDLYGEMLSVLFLGLRARAES